MARVARIVLRNGRSQDDKESSIRIWSYNELLKIHERGGDLSKTIMNQVTRIISQVYASGFTDGMTENDQQVTADIVLGIGMTFPGRKELIVEAITDAQSCMTYHAEGIVTGLLEIASIGKTSIEYECELFESIASGSLLSALSEASSTDRCRGRLSTAIKDFIQPAWKKDSALGYRLVLVSVLMRRLNDFMSDANIHELKFPYFQIGYELVNKKPMTCLESLSSELCSRLMLESGLEFKMQIIANNDGHGHVKHIHHDRVKLFLANIESLIRPR